MKLLILSAALLMTSLVCATAEEAPEKEAKVLVTLLNATQQNDLEKFKSVCDESMQEVMTQESLSEVSGQIASVMKLGYDKQYMGVLNRGDVKTHYWKIDFHTEDIPDLLAELSISGDKVAGFFIR